ncbi:hypothetical protein [Methylorubrum extorquens]|uniref:hypothetical protein n=1 Tax=Methylorubrum extorquens TaxID=408 RepID=UPI00209D4E57|nr:hypothetical protein [Methylorubrum extorquens]MCP1539980.1 hypothetical protein [Methylorubrum extorquens]
MSDTRERYAQAAQAGALAVNKLRPGHPAVALLKQLGEKFRQPAKAPSSLGANPPKREPQSEWATMKEEIARKAMQAVQDAVHKHACHIITERELWLVIDALFDTTHGLVDPDTSAILYGARQELKEHAPQ